MKILVTNASLALQNIIQNVLRTKDNTQTVSSDWGSRGFIQPL
jgi:hypothetical protein